MVAGSRVDNVTRREFARQRVTAAKSALTVLSAFTGAGGLDLGLEAAGFSSIGCIERDSDARTTLKLNRPRWNIIEQGDIIKVDGKTLRRALGVGVGELDLLAGGPPCQPFSKAAQWSRKGRMGLTDARSDCLFSFLRLVDAFLPSVLLIENVVGFVKGAENAMQMVQTYLNGVNRRRRTKYLAHYQVLNAADYGVPQRRERAIVVAFRNGELFRWRTPTHATAPVRSWDAIGGLRLTSPPKASGKWADLIQTIPEGHNYQWHTSASDGKPLFGYRTRYWSFLLKLAKKEPAWTIPAQPGPATGPFHWKNRPLAIQEMLRLQTFPASWRVAGNYHSQVLQIGNATPPLLAELLGRDIARQGFRMTYRKPMKLRIPRKRSVPAADKPVPVPRKYRFLEGRHEPHPGTGHGPSPRQAFRERTPYARG